ncbi:hypothetical protein CMUS01_10331 [Colletotrichum musicola]|uniref:Uncharacterized protein n=1 Tax=Colletotrichum musicola TaxID=2175873 RepID=A0A8H6K4C9_9PEZI|nr:hypothetical protein CMUS01_10331 [Colletotrichum musicola]
MPWRCEGLVPVVPFTWDGTLVAEPGGKEAAASPQAERGPREEEEQLYSFDFVMLYSPLLYSGVCTRGGGPNCKDRIDAHWVGADDVVHRSRDCGRAGSSNNNNNNNNTIPPTGYSDISRALRRASLQDSLKGRI